MLKVLAGLDRVVGLSVLECQQPRHVQCAKHMPAKREGPTRYQHSEFVTFYFVALSESTACPTPKVHFVSVSLCHTGRCFHWNAPTLADLNLEDKSETARLFQRSVIHETVIPLITAGAAKQHMVHLLAVALSEHLEKGEEVADVILKTAVRDIQDITQALILLTSASSACGTKGLDTLAESREGVKLLVFQAVSQQRCYAERMKVVREHASAQLAHGPALAEGLENVKLTKSIDSVREILPQLPAWKDALPPGAQC